VPDCCSNNNAALIIAALAAVFAAAAAGVNAWQACLVRQTVKEMQAANRLAKESQRARLIPEDWLSVSVGPHRDTNETLRFQPVAGTGGAEFMLPLRNIGRVPAFDVKVVAKPTLTDGSTLEESHGLVRAVFPVDDSGANCHLVLRAGTDANVRDIYAHMLALMVRVEIHYSDPLGTAGCTKFTMRFSPPGSFAITSTFAGGDSVMR
jgi:hypothetical protein